MRRDNKCLLVVVVVALVVDAAAAVAPEIVVQSQIEAVRYSVEHIGEHKIGEREVAMLVRGNC